MSESPKPKGFARFTPEERIEIARKGGQAAQARGTAHRWDSDSAKAAVSRRGTKSKESA